VSKKIIKIFAVNVLFFTFILPLSGSFVYAVKHSGGAATSTTGVKSGGTTTTINSSDGSAPNKVVIPADNSNPNKVVIPADNSTTGGSSFQNPLGANTTFASLANRIISFMLKVAAPIAVIMVIWSGILFMTSGGDEAKVKLAKDTLFWVIVAIVVLMLSLSVTSILKSLLN
jgi:hypothetical protein